MAKATDTAPDTTTPRGRRLISARVLWLAVAGLAVGLYVAALPYDLQARTSSGVARRSPDSGGIRYQNA